MSKKPTPSEPAELAHATVDAARHFKHDGADVKPGDRLRVAVADAVELVAVGAAVYSRRDMRPKE